MNTESKSNYSHPSRINIDFGSITIEINKYSIPIELSMCFGGYKMLENGKLELNTDIVYSAFIRPNIIAENYSGGATGDSMEEVLINIAKVVRRILIKTEKLTEDNE